MFNVPNYNIFASIFGTVATETTIGLFRWNNVIVIRRSSKNLTEEENGKIFLFFIIIYNS